MKNFRTKIVARLKYFKADDLLELIRMLVTIQKEFNEEERGED